MKRYYFLLGTLFVIALVIGLANRRDTKVTSTEPTYAPLPTPTMEYHWGEIEIEPFLYAVPLGTFTPHSDVSVFDWPGANAPVVGSLTGGETVGYTSEYTFDGETWLCVKWTVNEDIASWDCSGWAPASMGKVDRAWEYSPDIDDTRQDA